MHGKSTHSFNVAILVCAIGMECADVYDYVADSGRGRTGSCILVILRRSVETVSGLPITRTSSKAVAHSAASSMRTKWPVQRHIPHLSTWSQIVVPRLQKRHDNEEAVKARRDQSPYVWKRGHSAHTRLRKGHIHHCNIQVSHSRSTFVSPTPFLQDLQTPTLQLLYDVLRTFHLFD